MDHDWLIRALLPWETAPAPNRSKSPHDLALLARWLRRVADGQPIQLRRRLRWDGLKTTGLRNPIPAALPPWYETLRAIFSAAPSNTQTPALIDTARRIGECRLRAVLETAGITLDRVLDDAAWADLLRALTDRIHHLALPVAPAQSPLEQFLQHSGTDLLNDPAALLERFPLLARFIAVATDQWVETSAEWLGRLIADRAALETRFAIAPASRIAALRLFLTEPHHGGRSVCRLDFNDGTRLLYKPRPLDLEALFQQLVAWHNSIVAEWPLRAAQILPRAGYGWMEWIEARPCRNSEEAEQFAGRAGALSAMAHGLGSTDLHCENWIANGADPVLIDAECLLPAGAAADEERLGFPLLRSGLLPDWSYAGQRRTPRNLGGLGPLADAPLIDAGHLPLIAGQPLDIRHYRAAFLDGFQRTCQVWLEHRDWLLNAADSPLRAAQTAQIRYLHRPTQAYALILRAAAQPGGLADGRVFGIHTDILRQGGLDQAQPPVDWGLIAAEQQALAQLDAPAFQVRSDQIDVMTRAGAPTGLTLAETPWVALRRNMQAVDAADWQRQIALFDATLFAPAALPPLPANSPTPHRAHAERIATALHRQMLEGADQAPCWVSLHIEPGLDRVRLAIRHDLYAGNAGIALFLAAAGYALDNADWRQLGAAALTACARRQSEVALGYGNGLGGFITALVLGARFAGEPGLLDQALRWVATVNAAPAPRRDDFLSGRPGAILGLLLLHRATGESAPLQAACRLGESLCAAVAQDALGGTGLTGMSHGASGVALALLALRAETGEAHWRPAALALFAAERRYFDADAGNWLDLRRQLPQRKCGLSWCHGAPGMALARTAALRILGAEDPEYQRLRAETEIALATTLAAPLGEDDSLCCGNLGRAEILQTAGALLKRPALLEAAEALRNAVWRRACAEGGYALRPALKAGPIHPGLFTGLAGIGYHGLRAADPAGLPSLLLPLALDDSANPE